MRNITKGLLAAAFAAALTVAGCKGDANFAEDGNAARDQAPTTEGPAVTGKKVDPDQFATGGSGAQADCDTATADCVEPAPAEGDPRQ